MLREILDDLSVKKTILVGVILICLVIAVGETSLMILAPKIFGLARIVNVVWAVFGLSLASYIVYRDFISKEKTNEK
jgi:hypothetical protein